MFNRLKRVPALKYPTRMAIMVPRQISGHRPLPVPYATPYAEPFPDFSPLTVSVDRGHFKPTSAMKPPKTPIK